jgi:riboflavin transporter FmnP
VTPQFSWHFLFGGEYMNNTKRLVISALMLALALVLPFFTGQIPQIGAMLCPMHFPALLCGYICGWQWGVVMGFAAPLLRSALFGAPVLFPRAICMAVELAVYGLVAGLVYSLLPKKKASVYISLITAMIAGRAAWGLAMFSALGFNAAEFGIKAVIATTVTASIPGIILQLVLIPIIVLALQKRAE